MSAFYDNNITDVGRMLIAETQTGNAKFKPTKIVIGSGDMPAGKTSRTMTEVAAPVAELELNKGLKTPDGSAVFGAAFTNKDITQPFYYRELALYAKAVYDDGTEGEETLYSYGNAGDTAELIPAYSSNTIVERQLDLIVYIGNDTEVHVELSTGLYVKKTGDTMTGSLDFQNFNDFFALKKGRTLTNGETHFATVGVAALGSVVMEHYANDEPSFSGATVDGRLELNKVKDNPDALIIRENNSDGKAYRIYGEHNKPQASDVGLGNVPNVATNNQTPTYTAAGTLVALVSGEKLSVAFGKLAKAVSDLISHLANKNNPHGVTAAQAGAVAKAGDTMTGELAINHKDGVTTHRTAPDGTVWKNQFSNVENGQTVINRWKNGVHQNALTIGDGFVQLWTANMGTSYNLFGEHNTNLLAPVIQNLMKGGSVTMIKSIQRGTITIPSQAKEASVNINAVNMSKASVNFLGSSSGYGGSNMLPYLSLVNSNTVKAESISAQANSYSSIVAFEVVEYY